jgi:hypothetical protein
MPTAESYAANPLGLESWSDLTVTVGLGKAADRLPGLEWIVQAHVCIILSLLIQFLACCPNIDIKVRKWLISLFEIRLLTKTLW